MHGRVSERSGQFPLDLRPGRVPALDNVSRRPENDRIAMLLGLGKNYLIMMMVTVVTGFRQISIVGAIPATCKLERFLFGAAVGHRPAPERTDS